MGKFVLSVFMLFLWFTGSIFPQQQAAPETPKANARPSPTPGKMAMGPFDRADVAMMAAQCVVFDTEAGEIIIETFPEQAPESVRNFLNLSSVGLLDTTTFSRVVPGFVIQGGDLYSREGEITAVMGMRSRITIPDEPNKIPHERGVLSMARGDEPNTATTHFSILVDAAPQLDGTFAAFGRVTKGMDVVDAINGAKVENEKPEKPVRIRKASVSPCPSTSQ